MLRGKEWQHGMTTIDWTTSSITVQTGYTSSHAMGRCGNSNLFNLLSLPCSNVNTTDEYDRRTYLRKVQSYMQFETICALRTPAAKNKHQQREGARETGQAEMQAEANDRLTPESATTYRAISAIINDLVHDRPEISYAAKELCR